MGIIIAALHVIGKYQGVFPVQAQVLIGYIDVSVVSEISSVAVFGDPGTGRGRTAVSGGKIIDRVGVVPSHQNKLMVCSKTAVVAIVGRRGRRIIAVKVYIQRSRNGTVLHDKLLDTVSVRAVYIAYVLKVPKILIAQRGVKLWNGSVRVGSQRFHGCAGPFCQCEHTAGVRTSGVEIISIPQTVGVSGGAAKRIRLRMEKEIRKMKFGQIQRVIVQPASDHARLTGREGGKCPAGAVGILVFYVGDQILRYRVIFCRKRRSRPRLRHGIIRIRCIRSRIGFLHRLVDGNLGQIGVQQSFAVIRGENRYPAQEKQKNAHRKQEAQSRYGV